MAMYQGEENSSVRVIPDPVVVLAAAGGGLVLGPVERHAGQQQGGQGQAQVREGGD